MFRWRPRSRTARIILHSSHFDPSTVPNQTAHLRARGREMGLLEVGYHAVIERDGTVVECRPAEAVGSHCPGNNHDSIGVCLAGDTGHTAAQLAAAVEHCARLQVAFGPLEIRGHTELQRFRGPELRCPAAIDMDDFRRLVADHLAGMELRAPMQTTEPPEDKLTPQQHLILDYLRSGRSISTVVAIVSLGIMSISSRIAELRKRGYDIAEEWAVDHHERRYLKYRLGAEEGAPG